MCLPIDQSVNASICCKFSAATTAIGFAIFEFFLGIQNPRKTSCQMKDNSFIFTSVIFVFLLISAVETVTWAQTRYKSNTVVKILTCIGLRMNKKNSNKWSSRFSQYNVVYHLYTKYIWLEVPYIIIIQVT